MEIFTHAYICVYKCECVYALYMQFYEPQKEAILRIWRERGRYER